MITKNSAGVAIYKSQAEAAVKELQHETALKIGKLVVIAHGTAEEAIRARETIHRTNPEALKEHQPARTNPEARVAGA